MRFLGHVVSENGIAVDPTEVATVQDWSTPKNAMDIRSFLGLVGYYRKFMQDFSKIAAPLTRLTKKNQVFVYEEKYENAFKSLKDKLTCALVLVIPKGNEEMTVINGCMWYRTRCCTDARR